MCVSWFSLYHLLVWAVANKSKTWRKQTKHLMSKQLLNFTFYSNFLQMLKLYIIQFDIVMLGIRPKGWKAESAVEDSLNLCVLCSSPPDPELIIALENSVCSLLIHWKLISRNPGFTLFALKTILKLNHGKLRGNWSCWTKNWLQWNRRNIH